MVRTNKKLTVLISLVLVFVLSFSATALALPQQAQALHKQLANGFTGEIAYEHVYYLSEEIGRRGAGTEAELEAAEYIKGVFEELGYDVSIEEFTGIDTDGVTYESQNVVAVKPGRSSQTLIVGAHYDSVYYAGTGAGDNATGVGVMLEAATLLKDVRTHATIKFVAFGAEEVGLLGSREFVAAMTEEEIENTIAMINMDMVGVGDHFHVYAARNGTPTWVRDMALTIGHNQNIDIRTPLPETGFDGVTGDWSDHAPFSWVGIPIAYFEWWNWDIDVEAEGLGEEGFVYHTDFDTIDLVRVEKLRDTGKVVTSLIYEIARTPLPNNNSKGIGKNTARYKAVNTAEFDALVMERNNR